MSRNERQKKYKEFSYADKYINQYKKLQEQEDALMILVHPYDELQIVAASGKKATEILEDDTEVIFETGIPDIYLSCLEEDVLRTEADTYLIGYGLLYRLDQEDFYEDLKEEDFSKIAGYLSGRLQRVRLGSFCFPVIRLSISENRRREADSFAGRS